jgi:hypothetical protein
LPIGQVGAVELRGVGDGVDLLAQAGEVGLQGCALVGGQVVSLSGDGFGLEFLQDFANRFTGSKRNVDRGGGAVDTVLDSGDGRTRAR